MGSRFILIPRTIVLGILFMSLFGDFEITLSKPVTIPPSGIVGTTAENTSGVLLNEIHPAPLQDHYEWVELYRGGSFEVYLPLVLKDSHMGSPSFSTPGESGRIDNDLSTYDISGWKISDEDGNVFTIPEALPAIPPGGYVLIYFDGQGSSVDDSNGSSNDEAPHAAA